MSFLLAVLAVFMAFASPAVANHDQDQNGLSPIIPFQHDGQTYYIDVGESLDVGSRWGACTPGLANSFINSAEVAFEVFDTRGGDVLPSFTTGSWTDPVSPLLPVIDLPISDVCDPGVAGHAWWTFWVSTVTFDDPGVFEVSVHLSVDRKITDGVAVYDEIQAGGSIIVVVLAPGESPSVDAQFSCVGIQPVLTVTNDGNVTVLAQIEDGLDLVFDTLELGQSISYDMYDVGDFYTWQAEYPVGEAILDSESGIVEACP